MGITRTMAATLVKGVEVTTACPFTYKGRSIRMVIVHLLPIRHCPQVTALLAERIYTVSYWGRSFVAVTNKAGAPLRHAPREN